MKYKDCFPFNRTKEFWVLIAITIVVPVILAILLTSLYAAALETIGKYIST